MPETTEHRNWPPRRVLWHLIVAVVSSRHRRSHRPRSALAQPVGQAPRRALDPAHLLVTQRPWWGRGGHLAALLGGRSSSTYGHPTSRPHIKANVTNRHAGMCKTREIKLLVRSQLLRKQTGVEPHHHDGVCARAPRLAQPYSSRVCALTVAVCRKPRPRGLLSRRKLACSSGAEESTHQVAGTGGAGHFAAKPPSIVTSASVSPQSVSPRPPPTAPVESSQDSPW